ncbi:cation:proton antiporter [Marinobacterium mangrovicola]|uniref:Sodium/proton antiporter (CPA1 family) n=1 Tax=Marinobacterium mangrovicola TaxID=1476959 RepID=A0A4R1GK82_9GAMM|nr:sodium:proton antiporter [Marinobacterium mangrovicola]TCK07603.1 sodium/proton antiporter (CPA1 family) [Marinobacterium mangrovicola]
MNAWYLLCLLSALAVLIAYTNQYVLKLQTTIAITTGSVVISLLLMLSFKLIGDDLATSITHTLGSLNFNQLLLKGMLGFLLFAGALEIDLPALRKQRWEITVLVLFSTLLSTVIVGYLAYWLLGALGWSVPLIYCLLFGALISPTDPIAVLAIIKQMNAPQGISIQVEGESLFNDGVGLVVFTTIFAVAFSGTEPTVAGVAELFFSDALGGIAFGFVLALIGHFLLCNSREDANIRLLITLMIPSAGFALANMMEISGALAMVVSGIFIGNVTRAKVADPNDPSSSQYINNFWHATDSFLNALLFLLIGLMLVTMNVTLVEVGLGLLMVPVVLLARFISVGIPFSVFRRFRRYDVNSVKILTWGGLRGGLALAMAASIPDGEMVVKGVDIHNLLLIITYMVVIFSIVVQGLTIAPMIRKSIKANRIEVRKEKAEQRSEKPA